MESDLEKLIQAKYIDSEVSSGHFTIDREKSLERIAKYQLPYPYAWILKIAQAAVCSGSRNLSISQTSQETMFVFAPQHLWTDIDIEATFFDPAPGPNPSWQACRSGLWAVGLDQRRPFKLTVHGACLFWSGTDLERVADDPDHELVKISISHRGLEKGEGVFLLKTVQATLHNSAISKMIRATLFSCPLKVYLNGRRIDGFQRCDSRGFSERDYPIRMWWSQGEPPLGVPPACQEDAQDDVGHPKLRALCSSLTCLPPPGQVRAAALISAHAEMTRGQRSAWQTCQESSCFYWIKDGVAIQREEFQFPRSTVSLALFASADGLRTDFSGFGLDDESSQFRKKEICRAFRDTLPTDLPELELVDKETHQQNLLFASVVGVGGAALTIVFPPAILLAAAGVVGGVTLAQGPASVERSLRAGYRSLQENWKEAVDKL